MKKILISIKPKWTCKILNGEKTIEVRRGTTLYNAINRLIKEQGKALCLIYCTKGKPYLLRSGNRFGLLRENLRYTCIDKETAMNGKVVAVFETTAEEIGYNYRYDFESFYTDKLDTDELLKASCLTKEEMCRYLDTEMGTAIHIHNLKIFDKPKELKDFGVERSPQSWQFIEVDE